MEIIKLAAIVAFPIVIFISAIIVFRCLNKKRIEKKRAILRRKARINKDISPLAESYFRATAEPEITADELCDLLDVEEMEYNK